MISYESTPIGKIRIKRGTHKYTIQIRHGNCLAVLINVERITEGENKGKYTHNLYSFFVDEEHLQRIKDNQGQILFDEVTHIELNMYFKECWILLKYFVQDGHKVKCYYQEIEEDKPIFKIKTK